MSGNSENEYLDKRLRNIATELNFDYDAIPSVDPDHLISSLYNHAKARNSPLLRELETIRAIRYLNRSFGRPSFLSPIDFQAGIERPANALNDELNALKDQLEALKNQVPNNESIVRMVEGIAQSVNRAQNQTNEITARVLLPRQEAMDVQLVPSHSLERLEEYNADLNLAYLFIGTFSGATLGVLVNWATNPEFVITRISAVLIVLFVGLVIVGYRWSRHTIKRMNATKERNFSQSLTDPIVPPPNQQDPKPANPQLPPTA